WNRRRRQRQWFETCGASHVMNFVVRKRRAPTIIIVSLVDILIILLIFFVVSTTFKKDQPEVQINLPESTTAKKVPAELEHAIVSVDQNDDIKRQRCRSKDGNAAHLDKSGDQVGRRNRVCNGSLPELSRN